MTLGAPAAPYRYSALPVAGWTAATRTGALVIPGQGDADGKFAVSALIEGQRFVVMGWGVNVLQFTVVDVAASGAVTQVATNTIALAGGANITGFITMGVVANGPTSFRWRAWAYNNSTYAQSHAVGTGVFDPAAGTVTMSLDSNDGTQSNFPGLNGAYHRRRAYLAGVQNVVFPSIGFYQYGGQSNVMAAVMADRANGSAQVMTGAMTGPTSVKSYAMSPMGGKLFCTLTDVYVPGTGAWAARVAISAIDDGCHGGAASYLRVPGAFAGNARIEPISDSLILAGWTTGSTYGSYVVTRNPLDNTLGLVGGVIAGGNFGVVPTEIFPFSATKAALLFKGTGWLASIATASLDPGAPAGTPAATQAAVTASFAVGGSAPAAASGDSVVIGAVERVAADRILIVSRNATRSATTFEIFDLT